MQASLPVWTSPPVWSALLADRKPQSKIAAVGSKKWASIRGYWRLPQTYDLSYSFSSVLPRIKQIERISLRILGARQKHQKPLAIDAWCLWRSIDAVPVWKSLKQAWIFSASHTINPTGSCIYRKAINIDKHLSSFKFLSTTDCSDSPMLPSHNPKATQRGVYTDKQSSMIVYRMKTQIAKYRLQRIDNAYCWQP